MTILNLTRHAATPGQLAAGVVDLSSLSRSDVARLMTFNTPPSSDEIQFSADNLAWLAAMQASPDDRNDSAGFATHVMIGGPPYLMRALEDALKVQGITPIYAFSSRETIEHPQPDGSVRKESIIRHAGFVPAGD